MSINAHQIFLVFFGTCVITILWMPISWLLLSIFTPKVLLEKYFKEPHFTLTETVMMKSFPGFLLRTGIFGWLLLFPSLDKKRNIRDISDYMPKWYAVSLNVFTIVVMISVFLMITTFTLLKLYPDN